MVKQIIENRKIVIRIVLYLLLVGVLIADIRFLVLYGAAYLDSDIASEVVLADLLNKTGGLITKEWFYSTEIRIFYQQPFLQMGLLLFPKNWIVARAFGISIMLILLIVTFLLLAYVLEINQNMAIGFATLLVCPIGLWYTHMILIGAYYIPAMLFALCIYLTINLFGQEKKISKPVKYIYIICLILASLCAGLQSARYLLIPIAPMFLSVVLYFAYFIHKNPKKVLEFKCKEWKLVFAVCISTCSYFVGYFVNSKVFAKNYSFQGANEQTWGKMDFVELISQVSDFFSLFGFQNDPTINSLAGTRTSPLLFSLQGIAGVVGIAVAFLVIIATIRLIQQWNKLKFQYQLLLVFFVCSLITESVIFAWSEGFESGPGYWIPLVPFAFLIFAIECEVENFSLKFSRSLAVAGLMGMVFFTSYATIKNYTEQPIYADPQLENITDWLVDQGYTEGYSTFWNANVITVLSDGKIDMWSTWSHNSEHVVEWLQKTNHVGNPPKAAKVFVIIGPKEDITLDQTVYPNLTNPQIVYYEENGYTVIEYENLIAMK